MDGQGTQWSGKIVENSNRLSRVHERYRQTNDRRTDGRRHIANVNAKKSQDGNISPIWGEASTVPIESKILFARLVISPT